MPRRLFRRIGWAFARTAATSIFSTGRAEFFHLKITTSSAAVAAALRAAAKRQKISLSEWLRRAAKEALKGQIPRAEWNALPRDWV